MKKLFVSILVVIFSLSLSAEDEKQHTPSLKDKILQKNVRVFKRTTALQVLDKEDKRGVVARYREIFNTVNFNVPVGHISYLKNWKENEEGERVFITGLDHDTITTDGIVYHFHEYGDYFLYVWPIGIQTFTSLQGGDVRLKKYTVDPDVARKYYESKKNKRQIPPDKCSQTPR